MNPSENDYAYHGGNGAIKTLKQGFPGGPVVKNPPCNARNTGSIPGPGKIPCLRATEPVHWPQSHRNKRNHWMGSLHTTMKSSPCSSQLEKTHTAIKTQHSQEKKKKHSEAQLQIQVLGLFIVHCPTIGAK